MMPGFTYADNINTGIVSGGGSAAFNASGALTVDGNINQPGGTVQFSGNSFCSAPGVSVSASTVVLNNSSNGAISVVGSGGTASGFAIPSSFFNQINANIVEIGSWSNTGGIAVSGNAD